MTCRSIITTGNFVEILTIIDRLQTLPEYGKTRTDETFSTLWKEIDDLERQLAIKQARLREEATRILDNCCRIWTSAEIEQATGFSI